MEKKRAIKVLVIDWARCWQLVFCFRYWWWCLTTASEVLSEFCADEPLIQEWWSHIHWVRFWETRGQKSWFEVQTTRNNINSNDNSHHFKCTYLHQALNRLINNSNNQFSSVQLLSHIWLFATPWTVACQGSLTNQLLELIQTHVHRVSDAIQPSHPLSSPSPPAFNLSQHQRLFQWVSSLHQVAKVLEFQLQHQSFQWIFRTGFL